MYSLFLEDVLGIRGHAFLRSLIHSRRTRAPRKAEPVTSPVRVGLPPRGCKASRRCRGGAGLPQQMLPCSAQQNNYSCFSPNPRLRNRHINKQLAQGDLCFIPLFPGLLSRASWTSGSAASQRQQAPGRSATCSSARPRTREVPGKVFRIRESSVGKISSSVCSRARFLSLSRTGIGS